MILKLFRSCESKICVLSCISCNHSTLRWFFFNLFHSILNFVSIYQLHVFGWNQPNYDIHNVNILIIIKYKKWKCIKKYLSGWDGDFSDSLCIHWWILPIIRAKQISISILFRFFLFYKCKHKNSPYKINRWECSKSLLVLC